MEWLASGVTASALPLTVPFIPLQKGSHMLHFNRNGSTPDVDQLIDGFSKLGTTTATIFGLLYFICLVTYIQRWYELRVIEAHKKKKMCRGNNSTVSNSIAATKSHECDAPSVFPQGVPLPFLPYTQHGIKHMSVIMDGNRRYGKKSHVPTATPPTPSTAGEKGSSSSEGGGAASTTVSSPTGVMMKLLTSLSPAAVYGHKQGGDKLIEFIEWCIASEIAVLTVYAFSTENWSRPQAEVDYLMMLFEAYFQKILSVSEEKGICVRFVATEPERLPPKIYRLMQRVETITKEYVTNGTANITVNVCVSYGSRSEMARACRLAALNVSTSTSSASSPQLSTSAEAEENGRSSSSPFDDITEDMLEGYMLESITERAPLHCGDESPSQDSAASPDSVEWTGTGYKELRFAKDELRLSAALPRHPSRQGPHWTVRPDVMVRTSGEMRLSNFLLFESAYTEFCFLPMTWPEVTADDFRGVITEYQRRTRRFGK